MLNFRLSCCIFLARKVAIGRQTNHLNIKEASMSPTTPAAAQSHSRLKTFGLALLAAAVAAAVTYGIATQRSSGVPSTQPAPELAHVDAGGRSPSPVDTSLITRLLPNAGIRGVDKLDMGLSTYVWEVDMLADKTNPETAGFVYLSADGTKLLNGPLMDKRSKIMTTQTAQRPVHPAVEYAQTTGQAAAEHAPQTTYDAVSPPKEVAGQEPTEDAPEQAVERQVEKAAAQREMFLSGIEQLPYISTTQGSHAVYVLFDPLCSACAKLYKQHRAIAAAYDVEFRWIPIFNNEVSYPLSALLRKTFDQDHAKGLAMMDDMLNKTFKPDDHIQEISSLTPGDYGLIKPAGGVFLEITKAVPGIGTPFVMFKNSAGKAEAFGGVPLATDWASLK